MLDGDKITQMVNGRAVMRAWDMKQQSLEDPTQYLPVTSGRIMLQAEGAEVWFRNLEMKPIRRRRSHGRRDDELTQTAAQQSLSLLAGAMLLGMMLYAQRGGDGPQPRVVKAGDLPGQPPSDAIVLFDGKGSSEWVYTDGRASEWPIVDGALACKSGTGNIYTRRKFGRCADPRRIRNALHAATRMARRAPTAASTCRAATKYRFWIPSTIRLMRTGRAGSLYGQYAPLVNVTGRPKQWQTYDIIFHAPSVRRR